MDNLFGVLLVLSVLVVCMLFVRWREGSWFSPAAMFILYWTSICVFSVVMAPDYYYSPLALLFIGSLMLAFFMGGVIEKKTIPMSVRERPAGEIQSPGIFLQRYMSYYLLPATAAGFLGVILLFRFYDISLFQSASLDMQEISNQMTSDRYTGMHLPGAVMICLAIAFSGSLAGGIVFAVTKKPLLKALALLPFLPVLVFTLVYTARAPLLYQLILFLASVISTRIALKGNTLRLFTPAFIVWGGVCVALLFLVFLVTQMNRMEAGFNSEQMLSTYEHLRVWFFGNISGFSMWFDQGIPLEAPVWGSYSLGGLFEMMGISVREPGLYDTYMNIGSREEISNIFTLFRLLIDDLGIFLVHLFFFAFGCIASWLYRTVRNGSWMFIPLLAAVYAFQFWSVIASIFTYNTNIMAFLVFGGMVFVLTVRIPSPVKI